MAYPFTQADLDLLRKKGVEDTMPAQDDSMQNFSTGNPDKDQLLQGVLQANRPNESALLNIMNSYSPKEAPAPLAEPLPLGKEPEMPGDAAVSGTMAGGTKGTEPDKATYSPQMRKGTGAALRSAIGEEVGQGQMPASRQPADNNSKVPVKQEAAPLEQPKPLSPIGLGAADFGGNNIATQENLQKAQDSKNYSTLLANLGKSADIAGQGISGAKIHENPVWDSIASHAGDVVSDYANKIALQKQDPASSYSKGFKDYLKQTGLDIKGDISAEQAEKLMPEVFKHYEAQMAQNLKKELGQGALQAKKEEKDTQREFLSTQNDLNRNTKKDIADMMNEIRKTASEAKKSESELRAEERTDKDFEKMAITLAGAKASSRSAMGKAALNKAAAERIEALVKDRNLNELDPREIQEVARALDSLVSQGQATIGGTHELVPRTLVGKTAGIAEYLLNRRQGAGAGDFLKQMIKTVGREKSLADEQLGKYKKELIPGFAHLEKKDPERFRQTLGMEASIDTATPQETRSPQSVGQQDSEVQSYANEYFGGNYQQALNFLKKNRKYGK